MGSLCCCFYDKDHPEDTAVNGSNSFIHNAMNKFAGLFNKQEVHATPASIQGQISLTTTAIVVHEDTSLENNMSPPTPIPCNADSTDSNFQQDGQRKSSGDKDQESVNAGDCEGGSSLGEILSAKMAREGIDYVCPSSEDEDVCPTCLEEYTPENPKKTPPCNHNFHLPCIMEWMERSPSCPVCGKLMILSEVL